MKLKVIEAPRNDRGRLRARVNKQDKPDCIGWYDYVRIKVNKTGKSIICKLHGDSIYEIKPEKRKVSVIRINEPLRVKLGVLKNKEYEFELNKRCTFFAWYYFIKFHPDDIVKVATWLGIVAIALAIIAIIISIFD